MKSRRNVDRRLASLLAEALEHGCCATPCPRDVRALRRRVLAGEVVEPYPLLFADAEAWAHRSERERSLLVMRAITKRDDSMVFCGRSAALVHGFPVNEGCLLPLHIVTSCNQPTRSTPRLTRHLSAHTEWTMEDGVRVTPLVQTAVDCGRLLPFAEALAVMDALLRALDVERAMLDGFIDALGRGCRGVSRARKAAAWADGRSESGGESIARAIMIEAGIVPSDLQATFIDPVDPWRRPRVDYLFMLRGGTLVAGELDGMAKYSEERYLKGKSPLDALMRERQRESHLTLLHLSVIRFTMRDVWTPGRLVAMLAQAGVTPQTIVGPDYRANAPRPDLQIGRSWTAPAPPYEL